MAPSNFQARVKSVLSGDTLILSNINNPALERTASLAYVSAPRLRKEGDEPFAFESRDFLRKLVVGKVVHVAVLYTIPTGAQRDYATISLQDGTQLPDLAVAEGWLKLREDAGKREENEDALAYLDKLKALEAKARADDKGLWGSKTSQVETEHEISDSKAFIEEWKGKTVDSVVEKVISGDRLLVRLMLSPTKHVQTMLLIAGIRAPATERTNPSDGQKQAAEPHGQEAHQFVEGRLLQRSVKITVLGLSPNGQLVGNVQHPRGSIANFILGAGLARCIDHHSTMLGSEMGALRQAEQNARANRNGIWRGHEPQRRTAAGEVEAVVSRIQSADTIFLRNKAGAEKRVNLSSVRQPKPSDPKQAPFGAEAKEFLRKRLIGKHVKFTVDGKRAATEGYDEREMATIKYQDKNVGLLLVENGYASVIRHRMDDADRSPIYDELLAAEEQAQKEGKGMWSTKAPETKNFVDYSESLDKAKRQLTILSRQKRVPAVVDFVKSGSRFTVLVPRENAKLTFVLSGIRAPRSARNAEDKSEPFGQEAHDFANRRCLQRDVEIDVEDVDKVGGFIGTLYLNRESFAKLLVEEGLASVHGYSAEKSGHANELRTAEQKAKEARKGLWHDWDPSQDADGAAGSEEYTNGNGVDDHEEVTPSKRAKDYRDVMVTDVDPTNGHIKFQQISNSTTGALTELMRSFRSFHLNKANATPISGPPKAGEIVSAQFSEDGEWYRARVKRNDRDAKKSDVVYIDYGNGESVPWSKIRPLNAQFSTQKLQPVAKEAVLSYIQFSGNEGYLRDACEYIQQLTGGKEMLANVDYQDRDGTVYVSLYDPKNDPEAKQPINAEIVSEGLAMVPKKLKPFERAASDILADLKKREQEAKDERRGMWEYGDITED